MSFSPRFAEKKESLLANKQKKPVCIYLEIQAEMQAEIQKNEIKYALPLTDGSIGTLFYERPCKLPSETVFILDGRSGKAHRIIIRRYVMTTLFRERLRTKEIHDCIPHKLQDINPREGDLHLVLPSGYMMLMTESTYTGFEEQLRLLEDTVLPGTFQECLQVECCSITSSVRFNYDCDANTMLHVLPFEYNKEKEHFCLCVTLGEILGDEELVEDRFNVTILNAVDFDNFDENPDTEEDCDPHAKIIIDKSGQVTVVVHGNRTAFIRIHTALLLYMSRFEASDPQERGNK